MQVRSLGYRTDVMIRLLEGSDVADRGDYLVVTSPANPTYWWGNFLLLEHAPPPERVGDWLARFATEFPDARHVTIGLDVTEISGIDTGEFLAAGLRLERSAVLTARSVRPPPHQGSGAQIRQLAGDDDWRQASALRAVIDAGEPSSDPEFLQARVDAERALTENGYGAWFGAFAEGELVAQLGVATDGSGVARYQNVETHPRMRGRGLAGTLVWQAGLHALDAMGARTLVIVADPQARAIRVYRSVGFADAETQVGFERQPGEPAPGRAPGVAAPV